MTILVFFIVLSILVLIHEFGHFFVAKKSGMIVEEFGFGLPPRLFGFKWKGTLYSVNLLPFGGFVKIYGENPDEVKKDKHHKQAFYERPWYQRAGVIVAGPFMNFVLATAVISYLFTQGVYVPTNTVSVVEVTKNSPAERAGLKKGDVFVRFNDEKKITTSKMLMDYAKKYGNKSVKLTYTRSGQAFSTTLTPRKNPPKGQGSLGVVITDMKIKKYPWYQAPYVGLKEAFKVSGQFYKELGTMVYKLVTLQKQELQVAGPVGIAQLTGKAVESGFESVVQLLGLLSLNLALINLLPFPALDGGQLAFVVYETVTRRRINEKLKASINAIGFIFLLGLIGIITIADVMKLFR